MDPPDNNNNDVDHLVGDCCKVGEGLSFCTKFHGCEHTKEAEETVYVVEFQETVYDDQIVYDTLVGAIFYLLYNSQYYKEKTRGNNESRNIVDEIF